MKIITLHFFFRINNILGDVTNSGSEGLDRLMQVYVFFFLILKLNLYVHCYDSSVVSVLYYI